MTSLQHLIEQTKQLKKKMQDDGKAAMKEAFAGFFQAHPEARAIVWTQYTPYFNDGDACTFRVHDMVLKGHQAQFSEDVQTAMDENDDDTDPYDGCVATMLEQIGGTRYDKKKRDLTEAETKLISDFRDLEKACHEIPEVLEMVLGDHVKVIASPSGFDVDEYDHE